MEDLARVRKVTTAGVAGSTVGLDVEELKRVLVGLEHHAAVLLNSDLELAVRAALALRVKRMTVLTTASTSPQYVLAIHLALLQC